MSLNIPVILGSVREGRKSIYPARLMVQKIFDAGHQSQLVDFKEMPLPFFDNALMPVQMKGKYPYENVQKWSEIVLAADAFVIVAPEYNRGYSGVLKNALDWLYLEFDHKPVGLVGVSSGVVGGARAIEQLRPIVECFSMFSIRETVMFGPISKAFDEQGKLIDELYDKKIEGFLQSLVKSAEITKPYPRAELPK